MSTATIEPLTYDPSGVMLEGTGLTANDLKELNPRLEAARTEVLDDAQLWQADGSVPDDKQPLDAGFIDLPQRILDEYRRDRDSSELGRILATAQRLRDSVDRFALLGIGGSYMGARALFEACCHPYHNELSRDERGGRPRIYFAGNNVDNDATAALMDLFAGSDFSRPEDRWAIVVISKSGGTLETAVAFRLLLSTLRDKCGDNAEELGRLVVPVTGQSGRLYDLASALGCGEMFYIPDGVGGRFSIFTAVGLLPAAILGLDVVRLLEGAATMTDQFRHTSPADHVIGRFVAVSHLMESLRGAHTRVLSTWGAGLEAVGLWYDQLLAESLGKDKKGALPLTVVNTRDLHSRGQQHQEGRRDKLITNVIVDQQRRDVLKVGESDLNQDQLNALSDKTMPDILAAAIEGTNIAYREDQRPTADIHLPKLDEASLGQFFQMMMLATVMEGRLIEINPYGQPGVEGYKSHMNAILRR